MHFASYDTTNSNAGELSKVAEVKTTINESAESLEIEKGSGVPLQAQFYMLIEKEWILATRNSTNSNLFTIARAQRGTKAAEHTAKKGIKIGTGMEYTLPQVEQEIVLGPIQTDKAEKVTGSIWSEQTGTLSVEQSFDGGIHWDTAESISFSAKTGKVFEVNTAAPMARVKYVNGSTENKELRIFARALATGS